MPVKLKSRKYMDVTKTRNGEWGIRLGLTFNRCIVNIDVH